MIPDDTMAIAAVAQALDFQDVALLLDVDGTLLDLAPTPREVEVPPSLRHSLARLWERTEGALALVSGRPVGDLDLLFSPLQLPAVGGHGAEFRPQVGPRPEPRLPPIDPKVKRRFAALADPAAGITVEDKGYSLALHYRQAPGKERLVRDMVATICADFDLPLEVLAGKAVVEIKQRGFNKGSAVRELMSCPPFRGRCPVFIGDDITDHDVFAIMPELKGIAMSVGVRHPGVDYCFDEPADVRRWLDGVSRERALVLP